MSRIQDILAKAERDGTARRTQSSGTVTPPPPSAFRSDFGESRVDGSSALENAPVSIGTFTPTVVVTPVIETPLPSVEGTTAVAEARTAVATLHPLLVAAIDPHSEIAERYRSIRARISHREETMPMRTMMVTSPHTGDGKSITAANLALTMAQEFQRRVVLVDADFRHSSVHSLFGLDQTPGLAEVLAGEATLDQAMIHLADHRLTVIPAGRSPQFPTELLGSSAMRRIIDTLRGRFDRVIFDSPAALPLADARTFAPMADGVLMVVRAGSTPRPALNQALAAFDDEKVLGIVLNDAQ
jgi:protein-tyrosine kinase